MTESVVGGMAEPKYDVMSSIACQKKYCEENGYPMFAPPDGVCYFCGKNIYSPRLAKGYGGHKETYTGIPTFRAGCILITGCPHCNYSFVE